MEQIEKKLNELLIERVGLKDRLENNDKQVSQMLALKQGIELGIKQEQDAQAKHEAEAEAHEESVDTPE